ncbi:MAG: magnesium-translocating P-type ATPase [Candidatus Tyrphobacter sp.]
MTLAEAARSDASAVLAQLQTSSAGLSATQAAARKAQVGSNVLRRRGVTVAGVFWRQLRNPLLLLLVATATVSVVLGEHTDAAIILAIVLLSVGLGFVNEYRSERALEDLHARVRHRAIVWRDGARSVVDVSELVPGDVVDISVGDIVPADLRLVTVRELICDESILTGEAADVEKSAAATSDVQHCACCAYMGTVVRGGRATGAVVATGAQTAFGAIAQRLAPAPPITAFQRGLGGFSSMLVAITAAVTVTVFVVNAILGRSLLESLLFSLALAVGLTPQLLPAIVTVSLATGARRLVEHAVIVKRLVAIEDLGNVETLFTDKTGTLTEGHLSFERAVDANGAPSEDVATLGLICSSVVEEKGAYSGNPLDCALWEGNAEAAARTADWRRVDQRPFDYERKSTAVLADPPSGARTLVVKGAPEAVLERCSDVPAGAHELLRQFFDAGERVVALATRELAQSDAIAAGDETHLRLRGFLVFADPVKRGAAASLERLSALGITVKIVTGDNERVAAKVCEELGIAVRGVLIGSGLDALDDGQLAATLRETTIYARVTPEQKSRIIRVARVSGTDVAFLGDGVNDAVALHDADVGISVDSAVDVAKDAADVVLLEKDLGILADGVVEGRRIFANTIKYVLMGTSSNFGNMISIAIGSLALPFLPLLPSQILLNNLAYDVSEMTIPTDNVDPEQLSAPSHWDMRSILRFMVFFGPVNALFDLCVFAVLLWWLHAGPAVFRSGFFVETFVTQTLIVFIIRTRRVPFVRSRPSAALTVATLGAAAAGGLLPFLPVGRFFGFGQLPPSFVLVIAAIVVAYAILTEAMKAWFFRLPRVVTVVPARPNRRILRIASRWVKARRR